MNPLAELSKIKIVKRKGKGIWGNNHYKKHKEERTKMGRIIPKVKYCRRCREKRVFNHHIYCDLCWREIHSS